MRATPRVVLLVLGQSEGEPCAPGLVAGRVTRSSICELSGDQRHQEGGVACRRACANRKVEPFSRLRGFDLRRQESGRVQDGRRGYSSVTHAPRRGVRAGARPRAEDSASRGRRPRRPKGLGARERGGSGRRRGPSRSPNICSHGVGECSRGRVDSPKCGDAPWLIPHATQPPQ